MKKTKTKKKKKPETHLGLCEDGKKKEKNNTSRALRRCEKRKKPGPEMCLRPWRW
jgi:hypothetical protein